MQLLLKVEHLLVQFLEGFQVGIEENIVVGFYSNQTQFEASVHFLKIEFILSHFLLFESQAVLFGFVSECFFFFFLIMNGRITTTICLRGTTE